MSDHLIAGRGKSFGGVVGLGLWAFSWGLWAYSWAVSAATVIYFVRSGYDLVETTENFVRLMVYPFIGVPMELFVVLPYRYVLCPLSLWWADVRIPLLKKKSKGTWDTLTPEEKQEEMSDWAFKNGPDNPNANLSVIQKLLKVAEGVWNGDVALSDGQAWVDPFVAVSYKIPNPVSFISYGHKWEWNVQPGSREYEYVNSIIEDVAQPIYDAKVAYHPPKYCKLPGEPMSAGCDPARRAAKDQSIVPQSIFSFDWWFCREPHTTNCRVPCAKPAQ